MSLKLPSQLEQDVLAWWKAEDIFTQSLKQREGAPDFVFYEGPPTANGKPGIHHLLTRAFKDVVLRYKTMRGFRVLRRAGWDTHGLPVEVQVEKEHGLKNKQEIESLVPGDRLASIAKFNQDCRESIWRYTKDWEILTERMGYWLDLKDAYITYNRSYIEALWGIIKKVYDRGLLVKRHKVVPHCPRCETSLSSHELAQEYQDVTDKTVFVKLAVTGQPDTYFIAWTTTPWTLLGNIALAVGAEIDYVLAEEKGKKYYVAAALKDKVLSNEAKVLKTVKGQELVGLTYQPLFKIEELAKQPKVYTVIAAPFVTTEEGTGIVHTAAMYGADDYDEAVKQDLPRVHTVGPNGHFLPNVPDLAGQEVWAATDEIINYLKEKDLLYKEATIKHSYPHCWRCRSKLIYYAKDSWFITMTELRDQLIAMNDKVNWIPVHMRIGRYGEWLRELRDWAFSRERYWGTPLPVWTDPKTGKHLVVGSVDELRTLAVDPSKVSDDFDPHRPNVDQIKLKDKEGKEYEFEGVICDVWFDSGSMPFASGEDAAGRYPADYIVEGVDMTRGWFYTLQAVAALMEKTESPYKNVISLGHLNDEHGKKMSKSRGNIIDPLVMAEKHGVDAVRFYFYAMNQPGQTKRFAEKDLIVSYRKNQLLLSNTVEYWLTYRPDGFKYDPNYQSKELLDRWLEARTARLVSEVTDKMEAYAITDAARLTTDYLTDLSQWYIRRSRDRKTADFFQTLAKTLRVLVQLLAPFTPFITEDIWRQIREEGEPESVHLTDWPKSEEKNDEDLLQRMVLVRKVVELVHQFRSTAKVKVRQPLSELLIALSDGKEEIIFDKDEIKLVQDELNIERAISVTKAKWLVEYNKKIINHKQWQVLNEVEFSLALNTEITPELNKERIGNDFSRAVNEIRKKLDLRSGQRWQTEHYADNKFLGNLLNDEIEKYLTTASCVSAYSEDIAKMRKEDVEEIHLPEGEFRIKFLKPIDDE